MLQDLKIVASVIITKNCEDHRQVFKQSSVRFQRLKILCTCMDCSCHFKFTGKAYNS